MDNTDDAVLMTGGRQVTDEYLGDLPRCPACGHLDRDAWEIDFGPGLEGNTEVWCGACNAVYSVSRRVAVSYVSRPITRATDPAPTALPPRRG